MSVKYLNGDALKLLPKVQAGSVELVFADPPFNIGYGYDVYDDRKPKAKYLAWADKWLAEAVRVLHPRGSLFLAIGDEYVAEYKVRLDALGLAMRNWIVWHYTFGPHLTRKFGRDHAHILYYVRDPRHFTFNADAVRVESARQRTGDKRANPAGRVPGDVWAVPRLPGNSNERVGHPCQMPEAILTRIIRAATNPGELVLDPFAGSGTTLVVAKKLGRDALGFELSTNYHSLIRRRLKAVVA